MRKLSVALQWLLVLGLAGFAASALLKGRPRPERQPETWRSWQGFMALSYAGIGEDDPATYPSPAKLRQQLEALRAAGYRAITPEDALAFLQGKAPLPRKALLLLFEGGRKDSVVFTFKTFQKTGFSGTLCLPTRTIDSRGAFFLRRDDLRRVAKMGFWSFAGMGHEAIDEIPVGAGGVQGHFLTRRTWTAAGTETPEDYRRRVENDYATCRATLEETTGVQPRAYVYPFADAGQGSEAEPDAVALNREQVEKHFRMAFVDAHQPFNGPGRDPFDLNRLRVPGNVSGEELAELLDQHAPRRGAAGDLRDRAAWQTDGEMRFNETNAQIGPGLPAWVRGSDLWSDVEVDATVRIASNAVAAIYARYRSPASFLRATFSPDGIRLQENLRGRLKTLHWQSEPLESDKPIAVRLRIKGSRVWLWRGDEKLAGPLPLAEPGRQGRVGLGAETGRIQIDAFHAVPMESVYVVADKLDHFMPEEHVRTKAVIVPLNRPADGSVSELPRFIASAAAQGVEIIPRLPAGDAQAAALADLEALRLQPVARRLIGRVAVPSPSPEILRRLRDVDLGVIAIVSAADLAQAGYDGSMLRPDEAILVDGSAEESLPALDKLLATFPSYRTIGFLDAVRSAEWGIAQAVRQGS